MCGFRPTVLLLLSIPMCAAPVAASADTLYSDGPISGAHSSWVIDNGLSVQDSFTLTSASVLTGVTFGNWILEGTSATSVDWIITAVEGSSTPACSGCAGTASLAAGASMTTGTNEMVVDESFSLASLELGSGTYWLGLQNEVTSSGIEGGWDINGGSSGVWESFLGDLSGSNCQSKEPGNTAATCANSFTIVGDPVPEPDSLVLLGSGFALVVARMRSRRVRPSRGSII